MYSYQAPFPPGSHFFQHPPHQPHLSTLAIPQKTYKAFPSPATSGDSPTKKNSARPSTSGSGGTRDRSMGDGDDDASGSDDERSKLEIRREKNRVKQRNLRLRRANHITDLEGTLAQLQTEHGGLKELYAASQRREAQLEDWIRDLEHQLGLHGFSSEVDALRYRHVRADTLPKKRRTRDTLSTLANAAANAPPAHAPPAPAPCPVVSMLSSARRHIELEKKRKRDIDGPLVPPQMWDRSPLPPLQAASPISIENLLSPQAPAEVHSTPIPPAVHTTPTPPMSIAPTWHPQDIIPFQPVNYPLPSPSPPNGSVSLSTPHPSVLTARSLLLHLFPQPLPYPLPSLPRLSAAHQQIILIALTHLSPPHVTASFKARQFQDLSPGRCKLILEYETSPFADPRLVLFPVVVLRAKVIHVMRELQFDLTGFIDSTFQTAVVFGDPSDPDAWEMPDSFWDLWGHWMPLARAYCNSLKEWRRRDGHMGATVGEMLLGLEHEGARRKDAIGKPPGWRWEALIPEQH